MKTVSDKNTFFTHPLTGREIPLDDPMVLNESMEDRGTEIMDEVIKEMDSFNNGCYKKSDVERVLLKDKLSKDDFKVLLSSAAEQFLEEIALKARNMTRRYHGNSVSLFTPLYISNYCENYCVYCGFNKYNKIKRSKLTEDLIRKELLAIRKTGIDDVLILTGESRSLSDLQYIGKAVKLASEYFSSVGVEIYPLNSDEYRFLHSMGADYVTVFQETYDRERYQELHLEGNKRIFPYRFNAQERSVMGGMRGAGFGALLGLSDFRRDAFATGYHAYLIQKKYTHAEISMSCPRLRPIVNGSAMDSEGISERKLLQIVCAYRLFLPQASIVVSTRESAVFRDNVIRICATRLSAGVSTAVGSHSEDEDVKNAESDDQFEISDGRNLEEVMDAIRNAGCQPVLSDHIFL